MLLLGIFLAALFWFFMFSPVPELAATIHNNYFWIAMSSATFILTVFSFIMNKDKFGELFKINKKFILIGFGHAIFLYLFSRIGVWIVTSFIPEAIPQMQAIYATRSQADPMMISILLLFLIAPAEEIFWRGFIQDRLQIKFGVKKGMLIAVALYALVHLPAMNPMLLIAATVLGVHWGFLYRKFGSLVPGIISHAVWDTLIFVILPVTF